MAAKTKKATARKTPKAKKPSCWRVVWSIKEPDEYGVYPHDAVGPPDYDGDIEVRDPSGGEHRTLFSGEWFYTREEAVVRLRMDLLTSRGGFQEEVKEAADRVHRIEEFLVSNPDPTEPPRTP